MNTRRGRARGSHRRSTRGTISAAAVAVSAALAAPAPASAQLPNVLGPVINPVCAAAQDVADQLATTPAGPALRTTADAVCALGSLQYTYVTVYDPPGAEPPVRRTHIAIVNVPTPLDVGGPPGPELVGTLSVLDTGGAGLAVTHAPGAPADLPVSVEAVVNIPQGGSRTAAVGYDALASRAPESFDADFNFEGDTTSVALGTESPGSTLAVTGELFTPGPGGARTDPQRARVGLTPVPSSLTASLRADDTSSAVDITSSSPTRVDAHAEDRTGANAVIADATIADLPNSVAVDLVDGGSGAKEVTYRASAPIAQIDASLVETDGSSIVQKALLSLRDVPTEIDITQPAAQSVKVAANNPIGVVDLAFARGGEPRRLDPVANPAYGYIFDDGTTDSKAMRVLGLERAEVILGDTMSLSARVQTGPFRLLLEEGNRRIDGRVANVPSEVSLAYDPAAGTVDYSGSAPIGEITVEAADPDGLLSRATNVNLLLQGIPTALSLAFSGGGNQLAVDAHGQEVGLVELTATNGPSPTIPSSRDGLQLIDQGSPYLLFGRITGLRKATATIEPDPDLFLDATGNRVFEVDLNTRPASENIFLRATLDRLKPQTRVRIVPHGDGSRMTYSAASRATSLFFTTNGDDESDFMEATLAPVPESLTVCSSKDTACSSSSGSANAGAVRIDSSEHTTVNLFDCTRPLTGCTASNATESTRVENLRVRTLGVDTHVGSGGASGRVFFDTDNHELTGVIRKELPNALVDRLTVTLPSGFRAQNRAVEWGISSSFPFLPFINRTGTITCPPGTAFDVRLVSLLTVDVDFFLCP